MSKTKKAPNTVESILKECTKAVEQGMGVKRASAAARKHWIDKSRISIGTQFAKGDTWDTDKARVLHIAKKMGKVAAVLSDGQIVMIWAAQAAGKAIKNDPKCPAGRGGYCDF